MAQLIRSPLPIGIDDFRKLIDESYYYVDKTLLIKELIDNRGNVCQFTRPRRFGKTLTLSMIQTFFEIGIDNHRYFEHLKIMSAGKTYTSLMGLYPVINISLKAAKQPTFEMAYGSLIQELAKEYDRHGYLSQSDALNPEESARFERIMLKKASDIEYAQALSFLSNCLEKHHQQKVIILIDEYDVPLEHAYFSGFYNQMVSFIRSLFESALKTNPSLEFSVITGCLRISKESIFTGLNNLEIFSVLNHSYSEYFGFDESEVCHMLDFYEIPDKYDEIREWYDGYRFGDTDTYNPWSVINYVKAAVANPSAIPRPYWANTSSNSIIRVLVEQADYTVKQELETLIAGGTIEKPVHEDITYEDVDKTQDNLWNFLFFTGYLKHIQERLKQETIFLTLAIPNMEIRYIFKNTILDWFQATLNNQDRSNLYRAILDGDSGQLSEVISGYLMESISFYDFSENYYHGFLTGLLQGFPGYAILSNRESGDGRPDILLKSPSLKKTAIIMELKTARSIDDMDAACDRALEQIESRNYQASLYGEGYRSFLKYGISFYKKECVAKVRY